MHIDYCISFYILSFVVEPVVAAAVAVEPVVVADDVSMTVDNVNFCIIKFRFI